MKMFLITWENEVKPPNGNNERFTSTMWANSESDAEYKFICRTSGIIVKGVQEYKYMDGFTRIQLQKMAEHFSAIIAKSIASSIVSGSMVGKAINNNK